MYLLHTRQRKQKIRKRNNVENNYLHKNKTNTLN